MLLNIIFRCYWGKFGVFSFLRSWKPTCFLTTCLDEEAMSVFLLLHLRFSLCFRNFNQSLCRLSPFLLSYVAVKRAFFIAYWPSLKISQPVFPDNFIGPRILINCVFKLMINLYWFIKYLLTHFFIDSLKWSEPRW